VGLAQLNNRVMVTQLQDVENALAGLAFYPR
jgi:hypothetical protein